MKVEAFRRLLDAYGGDPKRWPGKRRQAALALLEISAEAREAQAEACTLDCALDRLAPPVESRRVARLLSTVIEETRAIASSGPIIIPDPIDPWWWRSAAILGAAACLGFLIGFTVLNGPVPVQTARVDVFNLGMGPLVRLEQ